MIVFSKERKQAIQSMKAMIKNRALISHKNFVLYSALRGQDIRKTSHLEHGDNAIKALDRLKSQFERFRKRDESPLYYSIDGTMENTVFKQTDNAWVINVLEEAHEITRLTPTANDGVNTMYASQCR